MKTFVSLLLGFAVATTMGCATMMGLQEPKAQIKTVQIEKLQLDGGVLNLICEIENPNSMDLKIDRIEYQLSLNKKNLTSSALSEPTVLPAGKTTEVAIPVPFKYSDVFSGLGDLLNAKPVVYKVEGQAKLGIISLPFEKSGEIKLTK